MNIKQLHQCCVCGELKTTLAAAEFCCSLFKIRDEITSDLVYWCEDCGSLVDADSKQLAERQHRVKHPVTLTGVAI